MQHLYTQTKRDDDDEPGSFSTDIDAEGISPLAQLDDSQPTAPSQESIRRSLGEGGGGALRVMSSLSRHREVGGRRDILPASVSPEILKAFPDVLKVFLH